MAERVNITSPVGRVVGGSLYEGQTTDAEGKPLVVKNGPNAGQPRVNFFFALAIPKEPGHTHWAQTAWGSQIWAVGHQAFPQFASTPAFSWKIEDGDDQTPNPKRKGRKNCDSEGYRGHWIVKFSGGFAPKIYRQEGGGFVQLMEKDAVKPGYYVEVSFSVEGNKSQSQPGVYLNHGMVCYRGYGPEINFGPDVNAAGFGAAPLPAGASAIPLPSGVPMPGQMPPAPAGVPGVPPLPGAVPAVPGYAPNTNAGAGFAGPATTYPSNIPQIPGVPAPLVPGGSVPTPSVPVLGAPAIPVIPNPGFVQVPPPAPPVPQAPPAKQMLPAAQGIPYASYIAQGWTDALLVQNGMMMP